jgi:Beta-lactamase
VAKFLPQFAKMDVLLTDKDGKTTRETAKRQMTIRDLFRHAAGFAYGEFSNVPEIKATYAEAKLYQPGITAESRMITPDQFVTGIAKAPLVHEPGTTCPSMCSGALSRRSRGPRHWRTDGSQSHRRTVTSACGTFEVCRRALTMSAYRGGSEVTCRSSQWRF